MGKKIKQSDTVSVEEAYLLIHEEIESAISDSVVSVGRGLVKMQQLYNSVGVSDFQAATGYETLEACFLGEFEIKRGHAYHLIAAACVFDKLSAEYTNRIQLPAGEWQLRELVKVPKSSLVKAWGEVCTEAEERGVKITAKLIREVVSAYTGEQPLRITVDGRKCAVICRRAEKVSSYLEDIFDKDIDAIAKKEKWNATDKKAIKRVIGRLQELTEKLLGEIERR